MVLCILLHFVEELVSASLEKFESSQLISSLSETLGSSQLVSREASPTIVAQEEVVFSISSDGASAVIEAHFSFSSVGASAVTDAHSGAPSPSH